MAVPRIIWRLVLRETLAHAALGLGAMALLIVLANVLRFLEEMVGAGVGLAALGTLARAILPSYFSHAIPMALVFGILLTFGRMSLDGEILALRSSGIRVISLLPPILALGLVGAGVCGWMLAEVEPRSRADLKQLVRELAKSVRLFEPGEFRGFNDQVLAYVSEAGGEDCPMRGVLIADLSDPERALYVQARCGRVPDDAAEKGAIGLDLRDGTIHTGTDRSDHYRLVRFASMRLAIDVSGQMTRRSRAKDYTTQELVALERRAGAGEPVEISGEDPLRDIWIQLHRRVAFPLAPVVLAIVAIPLGIRPVREGRSAGALVAIGVMAGYWLLSTFGQRAAEEGLVPPGVGIWVPSFVVLMLGLYLMRRNTHGDS